ncbi:hypothetical protein Pcinc_040203 [Petrolisthes cinctipes]|uniref:Aminopeptidase N n=1 Tax=Petrolisthes cinctipes TaxID=88211 RepID=A0AAE1EI90_PETCI|nr:hypothetical protein Pcinc_040203 [Petrolisthes cinctipes]
MTNHHRSTDVVAMDMNTSDPHIVSFGKRSGCFVSRSVAWLLALFFVSALVATGLLVYFYAPHVRVYENVYHESHHANPVIKQAGIQIPATTKMPTTTTTTTTTTTPMTTTTTTTPPPPEPTITATTTTTPLKEEISVRLPLSLKPLHYLVKLQPLINGNFSILGYVEVEVEVLEATTNFTLHIADIITNNNTVKVMESGVEEVGVGREVVIRRHQYDHEREFYIAHLEEALQKGNKYTLSMEFIGLLNERLEGFYRSSYRDANGTEIRLAATQFQATDARRAFPCFDEPGLKATFEIHLARQTNMTTISNMPIKETRHMVGAEGWVWDHYYTTVPMSTYLLAFVVSDFDYFNTTIDDRIQFRVWARKDALEQTKYAMEIGPPILSHFEEYFNQSYPLPKQDMIALPDFAAGAMENWGLITYRETAMLYDPQVSRPRSKYYVGMVISHELAHQWFGNLVTPHWWTDLWLNEGFASYVEHIGVDIVEPSWKVMEQFVINMLQQVFAWDCLESSHKIRVPVNHPNQIGQIFDAISYRKGASIIRMMNHFLTEATLRAGLSDYLNAFKYMGADQDDLWEHLTLAAHRDGILPTNLTVKTIMDTWTLQMGYPVITVQRNNDGNSVTVTQERFLLTRQENSEDTHDYKWWVPLTYTDQTEADFSQTQPKVWMKDSEAQITIPHLATKDHWVIFNLHQTGYYRVNYDLHNWHLLTSQLLSQHTAIATINRAQIIDDAMDLARAGLLTYDVALGVYSYLGNETEYVPWKAAVNNLGFIRGQLARTAGYGALKRYIRDLVVPLYDSVGFEDSLDDPLLEHFLRDIAISWACSTDHKNCTGNALGLFRKWMLNPDNNTLISPNVKSTVYCRALAAGGEEEWTFTWQQYLRSNVGSEKAILMSAMGCTKKLWLLSRYMEMAFDSSSGIRKQDASRVFSSVAYNSVGRPLAWTFLRDHWDHIYEFYDRKAKSSLITSATSGFNTKQQLQEVLDFKEQRKDQLSAASRKVEQAIESARNNIAWMDANYDNIVEWLRQQGYPSKLRSFWVDEGHGNEA